MRRTADPFPGGSIPSLGSSGPVERADRGRDPGSRTTGEEGARSVDDVGRDPMVLESATDRLRVAVEIPEIPPDRVFVCWVDPRRLVAWWPPVATLDARRGGSYEFRWPRQSWTLRGTFARMDPGRALAFSWTWDHEPGVTKEVVVTFEPKGRGTRVVVEHGPYSESARDRELRQEHSDGWRYFLGRLGAAATTEGVPTTGGGG
jgi:uncharacterized protein YndB with AHSA1/START domain